MKLKNILFLLTSFLFFISIFNGVSAYIYNSTNTDYKTESFFINGSIGNKEIDFNLNETVYDLDKCEDNLANTTACSRLTLKLELFNFINTRSSSWGIELRNSSVVVILSDRKLQFIDSFEKIGFDSKNNTGSFSCGIGYTCFTDNRTLTASFELDTNELRNMFVIVKLGGFTTSGSSGFFTGQDGIVEEFNGVTEIFFAKTSEINITIDEIKPYNASIGENFTISIDYGDNDNNKKMTCFITYSLNNETDCNPDNLTENVTITSITNNSFIVDIFAQGWGDEGRDFNTAQFSFNIAFNTTDLEEVLRQNPLICLGDFNDVTTMETLGAICRRSQLKVLSATTLTDGLYAIGGGGITSETTMAYKTYKNFPTDAGITDTSDLLIFSSTLGFSGSNPNLCIRWGKAADGITDMTLHGSNGGVLTLKNVTMKSGSFTTCTAGFNQYKMTYTNFPIGLPFGTEDIFDVGVLGFAFGSTAVVGSWDVNTDASYFLRNSTAAPSNKNTIHSMPDREIVYGRNIDVILSLSKDSDGRITTSFHDNVDIRYKYYNNTLTDEEFLFTDVITGINDTFVDNFEVFPFTEFLSARVLDDGINPSTAIATAFIDDGTNITINESDIIFEFYDLITGNPLSDVEFQIWGVNFLQLLNVVEDSVSLTLPNNNYTIRAVQRDVNDSISKDSNFQNIDVNIDETIPVFLAEKVYPDGYTVIYSRVFDGITNLKDFNEYILGLDCGTFNRSDGTADKAKKYRITSNLPNDDIFQCTTNVKSRSGISIKNFSISVEKNKMNVFLFDITELVTNGEPLPVTATPTPTVTSPETGFFTQFQLNTVVILAESVWAIIVGLSGGSGMIISIFLMLIEVWIMNYGKENDKVSTDIQLAVLGVTFVALIVVGLLSAVLGILFIIILGVLFGKKFHDAMGNTGNGE